MKLVSNKPQHKSRKLNFVEPIGIIEFDENNQCEVKDEHVELVLNTYNFMARIGQDDNTLFNNLKLTGEEENDEKKKPKKKDKIELQEEKDTPLDFSKLPLPEGVTEVNIISESGKYKQGALNIESEADFKETHKATIFKFSTLEEIYAFIDDGSYESLTKENKERVDNIKTEYEKLADSNFNKSLNAGELQDTLTKGEVVEPPDTKTAEEIEREEAITTITNVKEIKQLKELCKEYDKKEWNKLKTVEEFQNFLISKI